jgi:hypothetical protein
MHMVTCIFALSMAYRSLPKPGVTQLIPAGLVSSRFHLSKLLDHQLYEITRPTVFHHTDLGETAEPRRLPFQRDDGGTGGLRLKPQG